MIPIEQLNNRAYTCDSVAFNQRLAGRSRPGLDCPFDIPPAIVINSDGSVLCRYYAPAARSVKVGHILERPTEMTRSENGIWTAELRFACPGVKVIVWQVDDVEVLNPYAPIGFGYGRPVNYVDIPCQEQNYLMIQDVPHGSITREYFRSGVTGQWESCLVYTPPMYHSEPQRRFPVIYLQHGGSQNENVWIYEAKANFIADNLIAEGKMEPAILVMNNGMVQMQNEAGEWKYDSDRLQDLLTEDCIPFIDGKYRTLTDAWNRAYAGLSMGSLQGGKFFMERRDLIASAGLFTGYRKPPHYRGAAGEEYLRAMDDVESFNRSVRLFYIAVGRDEVSYEKVRKESEWLTARGINHVFCAFPGDHEWHAWRGCLHDFLQRVFREPADSEAESE